MNLPFELNLRFVLLLIGALFIIAILVDGLRRKHLRSRQVVPDGAQPPSLETVEGQVDVVTDADVESYLDEQDAELNEEPMFEDASSLSELPVETEPEYDAPIPTNEMVSEMPNHTSVGQKLLVAYALADPERPFTGYELLQAILSAGLRFGDMNIFHRYEDLNGNGRVLFSLASVEEPGVFDIQKMGAYSTRGLCFIVKLTQSDENFKSDLDLMLQTAHQVADDLGGKLLDDNRQPFSKQSYDYYLNVIKHHQQSLQPAIV